MGTDLGWRSAVTRCLDAQVQPTLLGECVAAGIALWAMGGTLLSMRAPAFWPRGADATIALGVQLALKAPFLGGGRIN